MPQTDSQSRTGPPVIDAGGLVTFSESPGDPPYQAARAFSWPCEPRSQPGSAAARYLPCYPEVVEG